GRARRSFCVNIRITELYQSEGGLWAAPAEAFVLTSELPNSTKAKAGYGFGVQAVDLRADRFNYERKGWVVSERAGIL
ncbi:MAG TPA: hypothetical protein DIW47_08860, partial [Bacteroidetes bacterium]|nr:hypothetical protein [Bacteroidota bacterium]